MIDQPFYDIFDNDPKIKKEKSKKESVSLEDKWRMNVEKMND